MSKRLKTLLLMFGFTLVCASCASRCGEDDEKPHVATTGGKPGASVMGRPRMSMLRDGIADAGAPDAH
jgi:hypothetical protein